jgi:hypothetical protein
MWKIRYFSKPNGRQPVRDWVESLDGRIKPTVYARLDLLRNCEERDLLSSLKKVARHPVNGFYELRHLSAKWRMFVHYDNKRKAVILLHGWRKEPHG